MPKTKRKHGERADTGDHASPPPLKLPKQWPMSTKRPSTSYSPSSSLKNVRDWRDDIGTTDEEESKSGNLMPGPCLQACSGTDVQLARGAASLPNLDKGKGRFLVVLPGIMSLKPQQSTRDYKTKNSKPMSQDTASVALTQDTDTTVQSGDNEMSLTQQSANSDMKVETPNDSNAVISSTITVKPSLPTMGRIEDLGSATPTFKVPFGDGRVLVFKGKKIETTSKFMMLACKSNKGSVMCKDIFNSVIVFGEGLWGSDSTDASRPILETSTIMEQDGVSCWKHYGGSNRAMGGDEKNGSSKKAAARTNQSERKRLRVMQTTADMVTLDESDDESEEEQVVVALNDDSEDEYVAVNHDNNQNNESMRRKPSRRSAAKATVRYVDVEESDEDEESVSDEDKDDEAGSKSDEEECVAVNVDETIGETTSRRKTRRSTSKVTVNYVDEAESDGDQSSEEKENEQDDGSESEEREPAASEDENPTATEAVKEKEDKRKEEVVLIELDADENDSDDSGGKKPAAQKSARKKASSSNSSSNEEDYLGDNDVPTSAIRNTRYSRRSSTKSRVRYVDLVESEDDDDGQSEPHGEGSEDKDSKEAKKSNDKSPTSKETKSARKSSQRTRRTGSNAVVLEILDDTNIERGGSKAVEVKVARPAHLDSIVEQDNGSKENEHILDGNEANAENQTPNAPEPTTVKSPDKADAIASSSSKWTPNRRRRSPAKRKMDVTNDDEFTFLG